jgi:hypothetical protein
MVSFVCGYMESWLHLGAPQKYKKIEFIPHFELLTHVELELGVLGGAGMLA